MQTARKSVNQYNDGQIDTVMVKAVFWSTDVGGHSPNGRARYEPKMCDDESSLAKTDRLRSSSLRSNDTLTMVLAVKH